MSRRPDFVSLPRRLAAGAIDAATTLTGTMVLWGLSAAVPLRGRSMAERVDATQARVERLFAGSRLTRAITVASPVIAVALRNVPSPGARAVGIRRVDARTGGPVSLRAAMTQAALNGVVDQALRRVARPRMERFKRRAAQRDADIARLRAELADDPAERERRTAEIGRAGGRDCLTTIAKPFPLGLLRWLSALLSPRRQTLVERAAGVAWARSD